MCVLIGVARKEVVVTFQSLWGLPKIKHLVYFLLLHQGDRGVKAEKSKYAAHAILNFHGALPIVIDVMLDNVRSDEGGR
jgi:hypothetical protein